MKNLCKRFATVVLCAVCLLIALYPNNLYTIHAETITENAIYVAPNASGTGSESNPMNLEQAIDTIAAGQTIYLLEGTYQLSETITIAESNSGQEGLYKTLSAYPGAEVVLDFSNQAFGKRGIILEGSFWHFYGITISHAGDNGMLLAGDNNIIELCVFDGNKDSGLQLSRNNGSYTKPSQWPSNNYILNCTSRNNSDPDGEDADGFAPKLTCGEGNVFDGCLAYNNVDDGWDCYAKSATGPIGVVTLINCIAFRNGQTEEGVFTPNSDGNGFKLGGGGIGTPHVVINCLAFENKNCGFTDNNNPSAISLINCTAFNNNGSGKKADFNVYRCKNANAVNLLAYNAVKNTNKFQNMSASFIVYPSGKDWYEVTSRISFDTTKSDTKGIKISKGLTASDFIITESPALGTDFHKLWREEDGSLNTHGFAMLTKESKYAGFSSDGGACGARFGAGTEFVTPENAAAIMAAALSESTVPTATSTPQPTATSTPVPTATSTPQPTATSTPVPTATSTPQPTATSTPVPTATSTPQLTATSTPVPTATSTPQPTATSTPVPTATSTPQPTAASTPLPAATDTPAPTLIPSATSESAEILPTWSVVVLLVIIATAVVAIVLIVKKAK